MNTSELLDYVATHAGLSPDIVESGVSAIMLHIRASLEQGLSVGIAGVCRLEPLLLTRTSYRHPFSGVVVPAKKANGVRLVELGSLFEGAVSASVEPDDSMVRAVRACCVGFDSYKLRAMVEQGAAARVCVGADMGEYGRGFWLRDEGGAAVCENGTAPVIWLDGQIAQKICVGFSSALGYSLRLGDGVRLRGVGTFYVGRVRGRSRVMPVAGGGSRVVMSRPSWIVRFRESRGLVVGAPVAVGAP